MPNQPSLVAIVATVLSVTAASNVHAERLANPAWRYTLAQPADGWQRPEFDDSRWKMAEGGFGTSGTPGSRVGTKWDSSDIWLRKSFVVNEVPDRPGVLMHHDEDVTVYINGRQVLALTGWTQKYEVTPLDAALRSVVKPGKNTMAVHCRQTSGGQFIDVHFVDADNPALLPKWKPFASQLITRWGANLTPKNAWTEYPRPQLVRDDWTNLNGHWDYAITPAEQKNPPTQWDGKILVPFCLESRLSGVQELLGEDEALWYRRSFSGKPQSPLQTILHFEAVDYRCTVFVNGKSIPVEGDNVEGDNVQGDNVQGDKDHFEKGVHSHVGGNTPFWLNVTAALREDGDNELIVRVEDDTEDWQLRGKQVRRPHGIMYTQVSGIWQTVWLERVPVRGIRGLKITTDADVGSIEIATNSFYRDTSEPIEVVVKDGGREVARAKGQGNEFRFVIEGAKRWSPDSPHLYDIEVTQFDERGEPTDHVTSYAGIRTVGKARDKQGHWRFTLNGKPLFHWGPLDQGWWPDGLLTPPSDEAMMLDIEWLKSAGFNMIRKHIKVEPRRYYYHCDRLGMMVWQDQVSGGQSPKWTRLASGPQDAQWPEEHHKQFMIEFERMVDTLENHPAIVAWVPFNEAWGQHRTLEVGKWIDDRDPTRLVNIASGGNLWPVGDIADEHSYPNPNFPLQSDRFDDFIKVVGEFGGHGYPVEGHLWDAERENWGYGGLPKTKAEYRDRYVKSLEILDDLRRQGVAAGVYTQTTDVEGEINGLMTYDRKVFKMPAQELRDLHRRLFLDDRRDADK
jgi:beta-galactosidase/beta-glucuronidase